MRQRVETRVDAHALHVIWCDALAPDVVEATLLARAFEHSNGL
jgi:hypothetical protein